MPAYDPREGHPKASAWSASQITVADAAMACALIAATSACPQSKNGAPALDAHEMEHVIRHAIHAYLDMLAEKALTHAR